MTHLEHIYKDIEEMQSAVTECLKQARALALAVAEYEAHATEIRHHIKYLQTDLGKHVAEQNGLMLELQKRKPDPAPEPRPDLEMQIKDQPETVPASAGGCMPWEEMKDPDKTVVMENGQIIGEKDHNHNTKGETNATEECPFS